MAPLFGRRRRGKVDSFDVAVRDGQGDTAHRREWGGREAAEGLVQELRSRAAIGGAMVQSNTHVTEGAFGNAADFWSFRTADVVASGAIPKGVVGVSPFMMEKVNARPGKEVVVRCGSRTRPMIVRMSPDIRSFEVELSDDDISALGLSDCAGGCLEIQFGEPPRGWPGGARGQGDGPMGPGRAKVAAKDELRTDNDTPPYTVDSGLGFWRRRKRA
ncbi:MAG: hypothetical protein AB1793_02150 [Candidatus Thermoplasmatota archaeon]